MIPGQLKQPHVLVGDGVEGPAGQEHKRDAGSHVSA